KEQMNSVYTDFNKYLSQAYDYPAEQLELIVKQIDAINKLIQEKDKNKLLTSHKNFIVDLENLINEKGEEYFKDKEAFENCFSKVDEYVASFDKIVVQSQTKERFYAQPNDKFITKVRKTTKRIIQNIVWLLPKTQNLVLKLFKKEPKNLDYKSHKIKKQNLAKLVFVNFFLKDIDNIYDKTLKNRLKLLSKVKYFIQEISADLYINLTINNQKVQKFIDEIKKEIENYRTKLGIEIQEIDKDLENKFESLQLKLGTFEFPNRKAKPKSIETKKIKLLKKQQKSHNNFQLNYSLFAQHQKHKIDINFLFINTSNRFYKTNNKLQKTITDKLEKNYEPIKNELNDWLEKNKGKTKLNTKRFTDRMLNKHIPAFTNSVLQVELSKTVANLHADLDKNIGKIDAKFQIPKIGSFKRPISKRFIKNVDTEIIIQDNYNKYIKNELLEEKEKLDKKVQLLLRKINEITQIIEFLVDFLETEKANAETNKEFYAGIERVTLKSNSIIDDILKTKTDVVKEMSKINANYIHSLNNALEPQNLLETVRKKQFSTKVKKSWTNIKEKLGIKPETINKVKLWFKNVFSTVKDKYSDFKELFDEQTPKEFKNELENYLSQANERMNSLPLIYQKLFNLKSLSTPNLYIQREQVDNKLDKAYDNWTKNKFASTCLIGESGSGITTSLNFFENRIDNKYKISIKNVDEQTSEENYFHELLAKIFNDIAFDNLQDLIEKLNEQEVRRVVILKDIHNLFVRHYNGFENIKLLLELISSTTTSIFWLCSVNIYAWKFLEYAVKINDYFRYTIEMDALSKEQLMKVISDRHLPSGYKIEFLQRENFVPKRKFKNLNLEQKQNYLQNDFYNRLFENSKGNIKLALLLWQSSIAKMNNGTFSFQYKEIDYSLLEFLGTEKLKTLHNILLHEGLNIQNYCRVFDISEAQSYKEINILENYAILININNEYVINPFIYREITNYLKDANFIY
ncbi:MAG: hypothetical protein U9Q83_01810, partial [Bacteroidota bacterium]|nr:hypothetical protein [Bacteroidota bacterium]